MEEGERQSRRLIGCYDDMRESVYGVGLVAARGGSRRCSRRNGSQTGGWGGEREENRRFGRAHAES